MAKILITGGTGLIGKHLSVYLTGKGHEIVLLSRNPSKQKRNHVAYEWNINKGFIDEQAFEGVEHVIHLAGEGIADKRWSNARKKELIDSRIKSSALLLSYLTKLNIKLKSFVGASAIGIYGSVTSEKIFNETDAPSSDFLGSVCSLWEKSYESFDNVAINKSCIRIGLVLANEGGAYAKMVTPFKYGFGCALGSGKQYMPWIHIGDLVAIFEATLFQKIPPGIYNAVSHETIINLQFSQQLAKSFHKPFFLPKVPAFVLKLVLGEMATILLNGSRVSNKKLIDEGFQFKYIQLKEAFEQLALEKTL